MITNDEQPMPQPTPRRRLRRWMLIPALAVVALAAGLAFLLGSGGPLTVTGTVTSVNLTNDPGNCILNLPDQGSQLLMKADGVTVATADFAKGGVPTTVKTSLGESCSVRFTFTGVPSGKTLYEVTINVNNSGAFVSGGCTGTVYYKPAQLSKPLSLSCS